MRCHHHIKYINMWIRLTDVQVRKFYLKWILIFPQDYLLKRIKITSKLSWHSHPLNRPYQTLIVIFPILSQPSNPYIIIRHKLPPMFIIFILFPKNLHLKSSILKILNLFNKDLKYYLIII